jgi:hypothetical protein
MGDRRSRRMGGGSELNYNILYELFVNVTISPVQQYYNKNIIKLKTKIAKNKQVGKNYLEIEKDIISLYNTSKIKLNSTYTNVVAPSHHVSEFIFISRSCAYFITNWLISFPPRSIRTVNYNIFIGWRDLQIKKS